MFTNGLVAYSEDQSRYVEFILEHRKEAEAKREFAETSGKAKTEQTSENEAFKLTLSKEAKKIIGLDDNKNTALEEEKIVESAKAQKEKESVTGELWRKGKTKEEQRQIEMEIRVLKRTDTKVKAHEQAHKSVGGQYTGAITYQRTTGPDSKQYVIGGEVSISTSDAPTPQETINKMQIVRRAALAPPDPSSQDKSVASIATSKELKARSALNEENQAKAEKIAEEAKVDIDKPVIDMDKVRKNNPKVFKDSKSQKQENNLGYYVDLSA